MELLHFKKNWRSGIDITNNRCYSTDRTKEKAKQVENSRCFTIKG